MLSSVFSLACSLFIGKMINLNGGGLYIEDNVRDDTKFYLVQGVCQFREVREKLGNSLYLLKSQGKVGEFSEKCKKSQGVLVKSRNLFFKKSKLKNNYQNFDTFQKFRILRG